MSTPIKQTKHRDLGGIFSTLALIILGVTLYIDTTNMVDADSYVFPRAIIFLMLILSSIRVVLDIARPVAENRTEIGTHFIKSILLVCVLAVTIGLIQVLGFLIAILIGYLAIMYLSLYEPLENRRRWAYPVVAVLLVVGVYILFQNAFQVQFPTGKYL